jgi:hypothetical protein
MVTRILVLNLRNIQVPVLQRFINSIEVHVVYHLEYRASKACWTCASRAADLSLPHSGEQIQVARVS